MILPVTCEDSAIFVPSTALFAILAVVIALLAIVSAPVFASVASPDNATSVATFEPLPTKI